jgi:hypothetical protein
MSARSIAVLFAVPLAASVATAQVARDTTRKTLAEAGVGGAVTMPPTADPATLTVAPSGRARAEVSLNAPRIAQRPPSPPVKIWIDYGQPHARGRAVMGALVPFDTVWRTGANSSTTFSTDVDLTIGDTFVPKGTYSLFSLPSRTGWTLVINKQTGQWGTAYDASKDFARIPMTTRTLAEPAESFTIELVPSPEAPPARGKLVIAWGSTEASVLWRVGR